MSAIVVTDEMVAAAERVGDLYKLGQPELIRRALRAALAASPAVPVAQDERCKLGRNTRYLDCPCCRAALSAATPSATDQPVDDWGNPIVYNTNAVDTVTHSLTGDEGEEDSLTVLQGMARYVENVWPGKTAMQVLIEYEEAGATPPAVSAEARHGTREDAYDQIDRFLRNNMDDESYAHYSQALDLVWGTPPADNKENGK